MLNYYDVCTCAFNVAHCLSATYVGLMHDEEGLAFLICIPSLQISGYIHSRKRKYYIIFMGWGLKKMKWVLCMVGDMIFHGTKFKKFLPDVCKVKLYT